MAVILYLQPSTAHQMQRQGMKRNTTMKKTLISLIAAAALAAGFSASAKADPYFGFGVGFGDPHVNVHFGYGGWGGYGPGYWGSGFDPGCFEWVTDWHWHHGHMVYGPHKVWVC
jgi:hypothetical protein